MLVPPISTPGSRSWPSHIRRVPEDRADQAAFNSNRGPIGTNHVNPVGFEDPRHAPNLPLSHLARAKTAHRSTIRSVSFRV